MSEINRSDSAERADQRTTALVAEGAVSAGDWLQRLGDDAMKWAQAFCEKYPEGPPVDVMVGWFANAIEHSSDVRRGRQIHSDEALLDHLDNVMWQRRFLRDLREGRPQ